MTSDLIFNAVAAYLKSQVEAHQGIFAPSETVAETLAMLAQSPGRWRCILQWQREDDTSTAVRNELRLKLLLIVQQSKGLSIDKGADVTVLRAGDPALLTRFNQAAAWMLAITFTDRDIERSALKQGNAQWLNDPQFPTKQISGEFSICYGPSPVTLVQLTATPAPAS